MHKGNTMFSSKILVNSMGAVYGLRREERMETHLWAGRGGTSGGTSPFSGLSGAFSVSLSIKQNNIKLGLSWARKTSGLYDSIWNLSIALKKTS